MPANYKHWAQKQEWAVNEAALLLLGIEPAGDYPPTNLDATQQVSHQKILRAASQDLGDKLPTAWRSISSAVPGRPDTFPYVMVAPGDWIAWAIRRRLVKRSDIQDLISHCHSTAQSTDTQQGKARHSNEDKRDFQKLALPILNADPNATYAELIQKNSALRAYKRKYAGRDTLRNWMRAIDPHMGDRRIGRPRK